MWFAPLLPAAALLQELPPITGSILATEAAADGCSITGSVAIVGALAAADGPVDGCEITGSLGPVPMYVPAPLKLNSTSRGLSLAPAARQSLMATTTRSPSLHPLARTHRFASSARTS